MRALLLLTTGLVAAVSVSALAAASPERLAICHVRLQGGVDCLALESGCAKGAVRRAPVDEETACLPPEDRRCRFMEDSIRASLTRIKAQPKAKHGFADAAHPAPIPCDAYSLQVGTETVWACIEEHAETAYSIMDAMKRLNTLCR